MTNFTLVFLSVGTTIAILALFVEVEVLILLLMAIDSDSAKTADANLRGLVGIFSIQVLLWNSKISGRFWFP